MDALHRHRKNGEATFSCMGRIMYHRTTREYYERRAKSARTLADQAASPAISKIHRELAQNYENRASEAPDAPPFTPPVLKI
jgi:hypothetical protein